MFSRNAIFRLCASRLSPRATMEFLRKTAPKNDISVYEDVLHAYGSLCDDIGIQLGRSADGELTIGVELLSRHSPFEPESVRLRQWSAMLEQLGKDGLCDGIEKSNLLAWPGRARFEAPLIDVLISAVERPESRILSGTFYTFLQHIKLTTDAQNQALAKAYVGAVLTSN